VTKPKGKQRSRPKPRATAGLLSFAEVPGAFLFAGRGKVADIDFILKCAAAVEAVAGVTVHVVDADAVCGPAHLASALLHARRAHANARGNARDLKVELMLYLSGQHQISRAMQVAGISKRTRALAFAIEGSEKSAERAAADLSTALRLKPDLSALAPGLPKLARLGVLPGKGKGEDLEALALEAVALLDLS
jgi:tRNA threonylcarbamoyladenosine modification (KEOPS) complex Cgi121 subunit